MTISKAIRTAVLILALSFPGLAAHAASSGGDQAGWVGALGGISIPNYDNSTARTAFGITGGAKLGSEWGIGAYYLTSTKDETAGKVGYDLYGIEFAYHFEGEAAGVYLGGRVGTSKVTAGVSGTDYSTSPTNYGALAGFNHFVTDNFSLGGEANFFSIPESTTTLTGGGTATVKGFTMLNFLASAKFWF